MVLTSLLGACATMDSGTAEEIVAKKAQVYWDARTTGNPKAAYKLTPPSYRKEVPEAQFIGEKAATYALSAKVRKVACEPEVCVVGLDLQIKPPMLGVKTSTIGMYYTEKWVLEDGRWWVALVPPAAAPQ